MTVMPSGQGGEGRVTFKIGSLLGESLLANGTITPEQLDRALREAKVKRELLGQALIRLKFATADQILWAVAKQAGVDVLDLDTAVLDPDLIRLFPESLLRTHKILPVSRDGHTLTAATSDLANITGIDELRRQSNLFVRLVAAGERQILAALDRIFDKAAEQRGAEPPRPTLRQAAVEPTGDERPAIHVVDELLRKAISEGASDIHIEPHETAIVTRFRYDGMLRSGPTLQRGIFSSVVTRIKILAEMNIAENRLPQDGRILHEIDNRRLDLRVSVFPTIHGENVAIRVLDKSQSFGLEMLGMAGSQLAQLRKCIQRPHGLFLVTGPTGSGKTTTLYSALTEINSIEKNIVTLEDPVEYELAGIRQTQINTRAGLTFVVGLRALLRQDPDVMLVGEMRDLETVEIAIRSAMTGHLVFSTLHTNDALGAIPRLQDMGVPPYLISSSLIGVLAQRLVRMICPKCKVEVSQEEAGLERLGSAGSGVTKTFAGRGCAVCNRTGYRGRTGVFELLAPEVLHLAVTGSDPEALRRKAIEERALVPMMEQAVGKISGGITTVDEVIRSVMSEAAQ
jgi:type IV pilus assembly protein PilB